MSANGDQDPPIPQRIFWALVEGATATALLVAGGSDALKALQVIHQIVFSNRIPVLLIKSKSSFQQ